MKISLEGKEESLRDLLSAMSTLPIIRILTFKWCLGRTAANAVREQLLPLKALEARLEAREEGIEGSCSGWRQRRDKTSMRLSRPSPRLELRI